MPLLILFTVVFSIIALWYLRRHLRRTRIEKLFNTPLDAQHIDTLQIHMTIYTKLPQALRDELHGHINVFLADKQYFGKEDVVITDEMRVIIAGNACLLLLQGQQRRFTGFSSIIIYPSAYVAKDIKSDGLVTSESQSLRSGESWMRGPVVLSWEDVLKGSNNTDGHNVVIHEFAHKLDEQSGHMNGLPVLNNRAHYQEWGKVLNAEFNALHDRASTGRNKVLDAYGTVSPAEFFAVASESFFEKPVQMHERLPELYQQLQTFYNIDPATWH